MEASQDKTDRIWGRRWAKPSHHDVRCECSEGGKGGVGLPGGGGWPSEHQSSDETLTVAQN